jgi:hypothetical protein
MAPIHISHSVSSHEPNDPSRIEATESKPPAPEKETPLEAICPNATRGCLCKSIQFCRQIFGYTLVGVENQNPLVMQGNLGQRPIPLIAEPGKPVLHRSNIAAIAYFNSRISTERIDHDNVVAPFEAV